MKTQTTLDFQTLFSQTTIVHVDGDTVFAFRRVSVCVAQYAQTDDPEDVTSPDRRETTGSRSAQIDEGSTVENPIDPPPTGGEPPEGQ